MKQKDRGTERKRDKGTYKLNLDLLSLKEGERRRERRREGNIFNCVKKIAGLLL